MASQRGRVYEDERGVLKDSNVAIQISDNRYDISHVVRFLYSAVNVQLAGSRRPHSAHCGISCIRRENQQRS
jgi:hypothetical protein